MKLDRNSKILAYHFHSMLILIQNRKWIKQWVLGCNFSDKILHFRYGLQSPAAKGSFKEQPPGLCQVSRRPTWVFWCGNLLLKYLPVVLLYYIFPSTINPSWGDNKNIEQSLQCTDRSVKTVAMTMVHPPTTAAAMLSYSCPRASFE